MQVAKWFVSACYYRFMGCWDMRVVAWLFVHQCRLRAQTMPTHRSCQRGVSRRPEVCLAPSPRLTLCTVLVPLSRCGAQGRQAAEEEDDDDLGEGPAEGTGGAADGPMVDLYGDWQTELWTRPEARDGVVPKNARGNVECPPLVKALPIGTVHLQYSGIWSICK